MSDEKSEFDGLFDDEDTALAESSVEDISDLSAAEPPSQPPANTKPHAKAKGNLGVPWRDYFPRLKYREPKELVPRLTDHFGSLNETLKMRELYKLAALDQSIHDAYYRAWVRESNSLFRLAVQYKKKAKKEKGA